METQPLYRNGPFMIGLIAILICFAFSARWAWTTPVGYITPTPTPNPNERVERLKGGIILRIPITPSPTPQTN